jgi:hypothetical protein
VPPWSFTRSYARPALLVHGLLQPWGCSIDSRVPVECEQVRGVCVKTLGGEDGSATPPASSQGGRDSGRRSDASSESVVATNRDAGGTEVHDAPTTDELTQQPTSVDAAISEPEGLTSEPRTPEELRDGATPTPAASADAGPPNSCDPNAECAPHFTQLVAGNSFTCGLTTAAAIRCWGLSPDHPINTYPAIIPETAFLDLAAADSFLCGIDEAARLSCWGLPNTSTVFSPEGSFVQVAAGEGGICAVGTDTTLSCWRPGGAVLQTAVADGFTDVAVGPYQICGLQTDDSVACWDISGGGVIPTPDGSFRALAVGATQTCAIGSDSQLSCWDTDGVASQAVPVGQFEQVALSSYAGSDRACAVDTDGGAQCWGSGGGGVPIMDFGPYLGVTVGDAHVCLLRDDETAKCAMTTYDNERWGQTTPPAYAPECGAYSDVELGDSYLLRDMSAELPRACVSAPWDGATRISVQAALGPIDAPGYDEYPEPAPAGAFPSIVWGLSEGRFVGGYQEAVPLSELGLLDSNWTWRVPASSAAAFAVVYEITVGPDPQSAEGALPIVLWLYSRNVTQPMLNPEYAQYVSDSPWTITPSAPDAAQASLVYYSTNDEFGNCAFCDGFASLSPSSFARDAVSRGLVEDSWYLLGVRAGFKVWQASTDDVFRIDVFDLNLR